MRRNYHNSFRDARLNFEPLEDRRLLAVGTFNRTGGNATTNSNARVEIPEAVLGSPVASGPQDAFATSYSTAIADDGFGFGYAHNDNTASITPPTGADGGVIQASASQALQFTAKSDGDSVVSAEAGVGNANSDAGGQFQYVPDPEYNQNLQGERDWFLLTGGLDFANGNATLQLPTLTAAAIIDGSWIEADYLFGDQWQVSSNIGINYTTSGGVRLHVHQSGAPIPAAVGAGTGGDVGAQANIDGFAEGQWSLAATAWAYVYGDASGLGAGQTVFDGDFNYDGVVDEADYQVWADGKPQADVAPVTDLGGGFTLLDGIVDTQDYAIWAANADAILVTTNSDVTDPNDGLLTLREAVALAADANHPGTDIIAFDSSVFGETITLTGGYLNLTYDNPVRILGPGVDELTISGNGILPRIFNVATGSATPVESTISHVKITNTSPTGAGVYLTDGNATNHLVLDTVEITGTGTGVQHGASSQVVIRNSIISDNFLAGIKRTTHSTPNDDASVTIENTKVQNNGGEGISLKNIDVSITDSEISGNDTGITFTSDGDNPGVTLTISGSTIAENHGPGVDLGSETVSNIFNSTISDNEGLGLSVADATATLTNVTVTQNRVTTSGATAGVYAGTGGTVTMYNTIVAENYSGPSGSEIDADLGRSTTTPEGSFSLGTTSYNLLGVVGNSGLTSIDNNIILDGGDAHLAALDDYGGKTRTHALLLDSLAIDAGKDSYATEIGLSYDQRGEYFDRILDGDGTPEQGFDIDIGAFELGLGDNFDYV